MITRKGPVTVDRETYLRLCEAVIGSGNLRLLNAEEVSNIVTECWYAAKAFEKMAATEIRDLEE